MEHFNISEFRKDMQAKREREEEAKAVFMAILFILFFGFIGGFFMWMGTTRLF